MAAAIAVHFSTASAVIALVIFVGSGFPNEADERLRTPVVKHARNSGIVREPRTYLY